MTRLYDEGYRDGIRDHQARPSRSVREAAKRIGVSLKDERTQLIVMASEGCSLAEYVEEYCAGYVDGARTCYG